MMDFGPAESWSSNIVQSVFAEGRTKYLSPEIYEFQIAKSRLPSPIFSLMLHFKRSVQWVPPEADTLNPDGWFEVRLSP
jgi:hypothetical protein